MLYAIQILYVALLSVGAMLSFPVLACELEIRVNDSRATVFVDDVSKGSAPIKLPCQKQPQRVLVEAPYRESFFRVAPSESEALVSHELWDVQLKYAQDVKESRNLTVTQTSPGSSDQSVILEQIRVLREMVEELRLAQRGSGKDVGAMLGLAAAVRVPASEGGEGEVTSQVGQLPELPQEDEGPTVQLVPAGNVQVEASTPEVQVPSDLPEKATEQAESVKVELVPAHVQKLKGTYVQLHALLESAFNEGEAVQELSGVKASLGDSVLNLCRTALDQSGRTWTKIFLGPFANRKAAEKVTGKVGRGTFVVRNPECVSQPKTVANEQ